MAAQPYASFVERQNDPLDLREQQIDVELEVPGSFEPREARRENVELIPDEEGGVTVDFDPLDRGPSDDGDFYRNLAEDLPSSVLSTIANDLFAQYEDNRSSRKDWEDTYSKGLDLLGFKYEERTKPFRGASGVTHPLLAEAVTQFQAQAFNELLPAGGPVKTTVMGQRSQEKEKQAQRVQEFMNYYVTNVMEEYTPEFDQMLFYLPLAGSTFKKVYYDEVLGRPVSRFVEAKDIVVPYTATDLETCVNVTHISRISLNDLRKQQVAGVYRDVEVQPSPAVQDNSREAVDKIVGITPTTLDDSCVLLECHVNLDIEGFEDRDQDDNFTGIRVPYIVTLVEGSTEVLSIRRNYREDDPKKAKIQYFVHYKFLPGFGFYGLGLIHAIGGLSRSATAALRQLIDAGTFSNLPAGFKARGLRIRSDSEPLQPGEFRDVDVPGGAIRDGLMPLPFKGPDATLFQLLGFVVSAGQRFATITDLKVGDGNQAAAVGTTVAMLEQGTRVMSAVHKRMHYAMKQEFKILARLMKETLPPVYPYEVEGADQAVMSKDFDDRVDVVPVSDPNIFSQSQRIALAQAQLQMAAQAPELHNLYEAFKRMYSALGVRDVDKILKPKSDDEPMPRDPAQENIDALDNVRLKAFPGQMHDAHIFSHMLFATSGLTQSMPLVMIALQKHVLEHVQIKAREAVMAQMQGQQVQPQMQLQIEAMVAQGVAQELQNLKQLSAQLSGEGQQGPDPLVQLKQQELQIRGQQVQGQQQIDQGKLQLDAQKAQERAREFQERLQSQERQTQARLDASMQREVLKAQQSLQQKERARNEGPMPGRQAR